MLYSLNELKSEVKHEDEEDIYIKIEPLITEELDIKDECIDMELQPETLPVKTKTTDMEVLIEDSLDGGPPSAGSGSIPTTIVTTPGNTSSTPMTSKKLLDAVHNGDIKTAKQLIGEGININFILNRWSPLHAALTLRSMDVLELLLSQPNIDLNISNERLAAPLLWSIESHSYLNYGLKDLDPEEFVLRLIRTGCDINLRDKDEATLLHLSILYLSTTSVTYELLQLGADVNAFCSRYGTALHRAIKNKNLELVCMLLYYNADVHIKWEGQKPFRYAVRLQHFEIAEVLLDYYNFIDEDVNFIINSTKECICFLKSGNVELFKAVWPRFDSEIILSLKPTFIDLYLTHWWRYRLSDWVECLYLILNSDIAFYLIEGYRLNTGKSFLEQLLNRTRYQYIQSEDWLGLIYMVLRLGFKVTIDDINSVAFYRSNQGLEPLIYHTYRSVADDSKFVYPLHAFVISMETDYSVKKIFQLFYDASEVWKLKFWGWNYKCNFAKIFAKTVAFFSFPADAKNNLMSLKDLQGQVIMDAKRLQEIPEFPSLIELSRNQVHKYLVQKFRFKYPYQLQDFVKKLFISNRIKNIILFKEPIY